MTIAYWRDFLGSHSYLAYLFELALLILGAWIFRAVILGQLRRFAKKTFTTLDDDLIALLDRAIKPLLILAIAAASLNMLPLSGKLLRVTNRVITVCVIAIVLFYVSKAVQVVINAWLSRRAERQSLHEPITFVVQVVFAAFAVMIVLDNLGISLTAVWTTLGVGSVAVALALQDTLSNFFAGVYLRLDNPVRMNDYIKLESGEEGFVLHQGWRSTRIRTLPNNVVIVPNAKLASTIVTNYSMPETEMSLLIPVGVSYDCNPELVEQILVEEARNAAGQVEGLLATPEPFVRFIPGFGDSSLNFTLICRVNTFVDQYLVQHELRKRILARFRREGISIPFPQRDVHVFTHDSQNDLTMPSKAHFTKFA